MHEPRWQDYFTPATEIDDVLQEAGNSFDQSPSPKAMRVPFIVTAVVLNVHYCNSPKNRSLMIRQGQFTGAGASSIVNELETGEQFISTALPSSFEAGSSFEVDIQIEKGFGIADEQLVIENVKVCNSFGGFKNFGFITPTPTTNTSLGGSSNRFEGDKVIVAFIGGDLAKGRVIGYEPHPGNVTDGPRYYGGANSPERGAFFRIYGSTFCVDAHGNITLDSCDAAQDRILNPQSGATLLVDPDRLIDDPPGQIEILANSNVVVSAAYNAPDKQVEIGAITLQSKTEGVFKSKKEDIKIYTDDPKKYVILQGPHEGTRPAARLHDKIKITSGNANDLFEWCARVSNVLDKVGGYIKDSGMVPDPLTGKPRDLDLVYAGNLLEGLSSGFPTYAEGRIIEGSPYVQIAGTMTSQDEPSEEVVESCTDSTSKSFAADMSGSACGVNDIDGYFQILDDLVSIVKLLEIPIDPLTELPVPLVPPLSFIQILPPGSSDKVEAIKPCLLKWLATCPKTEWPPKFQAILDLILDLTSLAGWINLFTDAEKFAAAMSAIDILIGGSACDLFDISDEETTLETEIAAGTADTATNGALSAARDECVDKALSTEEA